MKEKQTDLTVTNEPSPLPQLPVFFLSDSLFPPSVSSLSPCYFLSELFQPLSSSFFTYQALFPNSVIYFLPSFCSCSLWCSFTALPPTITFPYSLFCFRPVARAISELFFCFFLAFWKRGAAAFYHEVVYLVHRVDRPTPAHANDFPASVSCHRCD